jgi:hypothetical protein
MFGNMDRLTVPHDGKQIALTLGVAIVGLVLVLALVVLLARAS